MKEPLGVIGAGWVGLVTAACFADLGHEVVVRDVVPERIAELDAGRVPIFEPGLSELLAANRERIRYTLDIADVFDAARIAFVSVPTPPTHSGDADLSAVWRVLDELPELAVRAIVVMKSTVPVGTGEKVRHELDARGLAHVGYVSNPEFLAESTALHDFTSPDRIVVGAFDDADGDAVAALYESIDAPVVRADVASAEMVKLASNAFLATKISFINEIANVCEETGADVSLVAEGMGLDRRIGSLFLRPGIGYSGSCLPKDVTALKQLAGNSGYHFQLLTAVIEVNELQKRRVVGKLAKHLGSLRGQDDCPSRPRLQAEHERHARRAEPHPRAAAPRRGCCRARLGPRRARRGEAGAPRRRAQRDAARGGDGCRRSRDRHRMGRAQRPAQVRAA